MFYSVMGVFIGGLVDRYSRRWIMYGSITIWSLATAATGLVSTYRGLFASRLAVGFGEASISPAGHSLLALNFPRDRLATPLSLFVAAGLGGTGLAYYLGGELLTHFQHSALPWPFAGLAPWRQVMVAIGLPGLVIAVLAFTVRDPRDARPIASHELASWGEIFAFLNSHRRLFGGLMTGYAFISIVNTATTFWAPTYARTVLGAPADQMGLVMVFAVGVSGVVGGVVMGMITDWLTRRGVLDAPLRCFFVAAAIGIPVSAAGYLANSLTMLYIGLAVFQATVVAMLWSDAGRAADHLAGRDARADGLDDPADRDDRRLCGGSDDHRRADHLLLRRREDRAGGRDDDPHRRPDRHLFLLGRAQALHRAHARDVVIGRADSRRSGRRPLRRSARWCRCGYRASRALRRGCRCR